MKIIKDVKFDAPGWIRILKIEEILVILSPW